MADSVRAHALFDLHFKHASLEIKFEFDARVSLIATYEIYIIVNLANRLPRANYTLSFRSFSNPIFVGFLRL